MLINKVLIIRFSSFGDIVQCSSVVDQISQGYPQAKIDWATRSDFVELVKLNEKIHGVWSLERKNGIRDLIKLGIKLRKNKYDCVYDAHNNLRSKILLLFLCTRVFSKPLLISRSKDRIKRILLFTFKINTFPKPFKGIDSFITPLKKLKINFIKKERLVSWNLSFLETPIKEKNYITLVPSAAWEMKRWPLAYWKKLISFFPNENIVVLGGSEDFFCEELKKISPKNVKNLAGKLSLIESASVIEKSDCVVSGDTGLLHVADVLGIKGIGLMGPTAFGFTMNPKIKILETKLECRPCSKDGRGTCSQKIYQRCMVEITPEMVASEIQKLLHG